MQRHSVYHGRLAAAIRLMAATIQLIAASPITEACRVFLRRNCRHFRRELSDALLAPWLPWRRQPSLMSGSGHRNRSEVMARLRRFAIALFAASTVAAGSLVLPAEASAMPMSCAVRYQLSRSYYATAQVLYSLGQYEAAHFWAGKAYGILEGC
jgi:hypothetical protein